jgi:hypothetical protein
MGLVPFREVVMDWTLLKIFEVLAGCSSILGITDQIRIVDRDAMKVHFRLMWNHLGREFQFGT